MKIYQLTYLRAKLKIYYFKITEFYIHKNVNNVKRKSPRNHTKITKKQHENHQENHTKITKKQEKIFIFDFCSY